MIINFGSMGNDFLVPSGKHLPARGETIVSAEEFVHTPGGGKGMNQAVAAARAGADVKMAGKLGHDAYGDAVLDTLGREGVDKSLIETTDRIKTGVAFIFVDSAGENSIINCAGANLQAKQATIPDDMLNEDSIVMLQMEVAYEENWALIDRSKRNGATTVLNVAPADEVPLQTLENLDYLIVNEVEAAQIAASLNIDISTRDFSNLAQDIAEQCQLACIITLGGDGLVAYKGGEHHKVPAFAPGEIRDTTGAGDAFCGGFIAALETGHDFATALQHGNITGGLACTQIGCQTALPTADEIARYAREFSA